MLCYCAHRAQTHPVKNWTKSNRIDRQWHHSDNYVVLLTTQFLFFSYLSFVCSFRVLYFSSHFIDIAKWLIEEPQFKTQWNNNMYYHYQTNEHFQFTFADKSNCNCCAYFITKTNKKRRRKNPLENSRATVFTYAVSRTKAAPKKERKEIERKHHHLSHTQSAKIPEALFQQLITARVCVKCSHFTHKRLSISLLLRKLYAQCACTVCANCAALPDRQFECKQQ